MAVFRTAPERPDWSKLQALHDRAHRCDVSWSLDYQESDGRWSVTISSHAPAENYVGRSSGFDAAIAGALDWMSDWPQAGE